MNIVHVGPRSARHGGPAGYLRQLGAAFDLHGHGAHDVRLPSTTAQESVAAPLQWRVPSFARRLRRMLFGAPKYYRPSSRELLTPNGPLSSALAESWAATQHESASALKEARAAKADVIFAHDTASAEAALAERAPGQQVWVFLHNPMPYALYVAWCWGVPEQPWDTVVTLPDVQTWMAREVDVLDRVDRVVLPSHEAAGELVRAHRAFLAPLRRADFLLTGAAGPPRRHPSATRRELRRHWNLPEDERIGLFLGNAQPYRGLDLLSSAVAALPASKDMPGMIAVAGVDAEMLLSHRRLRGLGRVENVTDLLATVDFVVNVNRFSLLDLSLIEATEAGKALLLHDLGGNRTFARLGAGAVMLDSLSAATLRDAVHRMFTMDGGSLAALGIASRSCYEEHFTLRHLRDRHVALYDQATVAAPA